MKHFINTYKFNREIKYNKMPHVDPRSLLGGMRFERPLSPSSFLPIN